MKKKIVLLMLFAVSIMVRAQLSFSPDAESVMNLAGKWIVLLDSAKQYPVILPGSLAENKIGIAVKDSVVGRLSEEFHYEGKAVYLRTIEIPNEWDNKPIKLFMERTKYSTLYIDEVLIGTQSSVSAPHEYVLREGLKKGEHQLKLVIDNTKSLLPLGGSHAYSEHTQTNWNGIIGDFYLRRLNDLDIRNMRVDASVDGECVLTVGLFNNIRKSMKESFKLTVYDGLGNVCVQNEFPTTIKNNVNSLHFKFQIPDPQLWDEYNPYLYDVCIETESGVNQKMKFGFRYFQSKDGKLLINNRTVFLRGKNDGCVFPLTGYSPMEKEDWLKQLSIARSYGINHIRYHSWTPPSAAFEAADELGLFLQVELPLWGKYEENDTSIVKYMMHEGTKIIEAYGNHPSFVMLTLGNELLGDTLGMESVVNKLKSIDKRHLYAMGSNNFYWNPHPYDCEDFFVSMRIGKPHPDNITDLRGAFNFRNAKGGGIINSRYPNTGRDFSKAVQDLNKPVVAHETGQYQVYPDFKEMSLYKGVLKPLNFEVIKKRLEDKGLFDKREAFLKASGALSVLCYREEIEMALRTKNFDGFQLLDLQDFPGQGTSLVGILNAFMGTKNLITPEEWRRFCNDIVPLARFSKYCWNSDELFSVDIDVAHYGRNDLFNQNISCILTTEKGDVLYEKTFTTNLKQGDVNRIGHLQIPLTEYSLSNQKLYFNVKLENTDYNNSWNLWVYSKTTDIKEGFYKGVCVTRDIKNFEECIENNQKVLYIPKDEDMTGKSVGGLFTTDFWNFSTSKKAIKEGKIPSPGTFGLLVNSEHPIFSLFPTEFHSNWQWWNVVTNSHPVILDNYKEKCTPIVQVIDNWDRNHSLGLIYEIPRSGGNAIVCASDLFACKENVEVKALFESIISYLQSK